MNDNDNIRWTAKHDVFRSTNDYSDLIRIISGYYDMYSKCVSFLGPWLAKQQGPAPGAVFIPPDKEQIKAALGKEKSMISYIARSKFIDSVISFVNKTRGRRTLITPSPSTHHSAQFPSGTFSIEAVDLKDSIFPKSNFKKSQSIHKIVFYGSDIPVFIENLRLPPEQIQFIILRPKMGKLGTPSASKWEVLLFKTNYGYLVEHVDSHLNPRWAGIYA